jgi:RNA polymerase sigma-70 factor (ECF subfamily)
VSFETNPVWSADIRVAHSAWADGVLATSSACADARARDALIAILGKLDQFRGDALFTTWARRFAALEVPGKIRRRLGHTRETPTDADHWPPLDRVAYEDPQERCEAGELARTLGYLIAHELTAHQRDVLLALTVEEVATKKLAARLNSTPGALYKTLHDARRKLKQQLAHDRADHDHQRAASGPGAEPPGQVACDDADRLAPVIAPIIGTGAER